MPKKTGGAYTQLYYLSYLCIIMHIRNTNSDVSVAMVLLIMLSVANSTRFRGL